LTFFIAVLASLALFGMALIYFGTRPIPPDEQ
jgi:hypothetical protein